MTTARTARHVCGHEVRLAVVHSVGLAISCLITYWLVTELLAHVFSVSVSDDLLGGMWAVIATVFVYRSSYRGSLAAAQSRISATFVSFILCQLYLLVFPFSAWGMVTLIGIGSVILTLIGRTDDVVTASITTTVVIVVAALSPDDARLQPILRVVDTVIGVAVGIVAAFIRRLQPSSLTAQTPLSRLVSGRARQRSSSVPDGEAV